MAKEIQAGKYTYGHTNIKHMPLRGGTFSIGKFCSIGPGCTIYTGRGGHRKEFVSTYPFGAIYAKEFPNNFSRLLLKDKGNVIIENDVWIGRNATIMPGVRIGSGSIIANNSHVVKSCEPYSIIGGNPAKLIRKRFSESQIKELCKIKWWDWDDARINKNLQLITSDNIDKFIKEHK